ncbi:MAG: carbohydrate deacetylase [Desulfofundulus sp.]|uniref:carbohydrate deacetylase n=1 Tax=Desulfofundulus sp. TaxID=2282750 RepID=UPI003C7835A7
MLLIVNADDFGYTVGVNRGIIKAMECGVVTSTSLMVNQPGTGDALAFLQQGMLETAGVHLCLTAGRPVSDPAAVPSLVDSRGRFKGKDALLSGHLNGEEVRREFIAQVEKVRMAGVRVSHLDTHHHVHAHPVILEALADVARSYGLPVRSLDPSMRGILARRGIPAPDCFCGHWFGEQVSAELFHRFVTAGLQGGARVMELMTHPGLVDEELRRRSSYTWQRERELAILCDPATREWLFEQGVKPGSYLDLTYSVLRRSD